MAKDLEPFEAQIREYDGRLIGCARKLVALADVGASWERLDAEVGFMDTLQAHRRAVLAEYARRGGKVMDIYTFGPYVGTNSPRPEASAKVLEGNT